VPRTHPPLTITFGREDWILPVVLARRAQSHGEKIYLREAEGQNRVWTYREVATEASSIGSALLRRGYRQGDRLALMMPNCPEYVLAWFGSATAGIVEAPINLEFCGGFLERVLELLGPRGIVTTPELVERFIESAPRLSDNLEFFLVGESDDVQLTIPRLRRRGWSAHAFESLRGTEASNRAVEIRRQDLASIICTSGTTGPSKGVMMSQAQQYLLAEESINLLRLRETDVVPLALPMFHSNAQFMTAYAALVVGATVVLYEKFSASKFLQRAREDGLTVANLLGEMMTWVWQQPATPDDRAHNLRCIMSVPTPASIAAEFRDRFGIEAVTEGFGLSETCFQFLSPYGEDRPAGAAGLLCDEFFDVRLADPETDEEVPVGEVGELLVRSKEPWLINLGYWRNAEATADARRNLWFHTGDGLRRDEDGWYYFSDRIKDSIRRNGENISSFEVEQAVVEHPAVTDCAVVAVRPAEQGRDDDVMAVVVLDDPLSIEELVEWSGKRMPRFLWPRYWRITSDLPKTPSGKIQKALLREQGVTVDTFDRKAEDG